jgi:hypothetical protein
MSSTFPKAPWSKLFASLAGGVATLVIGGCAVAPSDDPGTVAELVVALPPQVAKAATYVAQINQDDQVNNDYGWNASIEYVGGVLHATTECGSFTALLFENAYPGVVTPAVISALTGATLPDAAGWYGGIAPATARGAFQGISLGPLDAAEVTPTGRTLSDLRVGDILAAQYVIGSQTGHVMTVGAFTPPAGTVTLPADAIPGVSKAARWLVEVYDSTDSIHGSVTGSTDSRYHNDALNRDGNNHGIGSGYIDLYADATAGSETAGQLVGWTWSTASGSIYQMTDPSASLYRPMVIGRMSGGAL